MLIPVVSAFGQADTAKLNIRGTVYENQSLDPLEGAQVRLTTAEGKLKAGALTQKNGQFLLPNIPTGTYTLSVTFMGFKEQKFSLTLPKRSGNYKVNDVMMREDAKVMGEATVEGKLAEMTVVDDTVMYNADAFKLEDGALVEDLVKKLPGIVQGEDGSFTWNGKAISQILVDGKEFFGSNMNMVLKNLPAEIVDKVKAYEKQSDFARITGVDDGQERTVLDLAIKKNRNRGWFGDLSGGYGTHDRYNGRVMVNRFIGAQKFSVVGNGNSNGLSDNQGGGFTMNYQKDKVLELNGTVNGNFSQGRSQSWSNSQNFENQNAAYSNSWNKGNSNSKEGSMEYKVEWKPDTMTNILIRPNISLRGSRNNSMNENASFKDNPYLYSDDPLADYWKFSHEIGVNHRLSRNHSSSNNFNVSGSVQVNRRLAKPGRNVTLNADASYSNSTSESQSYSQIDYYQILAMTGDDSLYHKIQYNNSPTKNRNVSTRLTYIEPVGRQMYLQMSYQYNYRFSDRDRNVASIFDWMPNGENSLYNPYLNYGINGDNYRLWEHIAQPDIDQCNYTTNTYQNHDIRLQLRINRTLYRLTVGANLQPQVNRVDYTKGTKHYDIRRSVFNASPTVNFRYLFSRQEQLEFRYNGSTGQPGITDLIPDTLSNADPLNIRLGNPELAPSFTHNMNGSYRRTVVDKQRTSALSFSFRTTQNSTTQRTEYNDVTGGRISKPVNINGNWNGSTSFNFNTAMGENKYWLINTSTTGSITNSVGYVYRSALQETVKNRTRGMNARQTLRLTYRRSWDNKMEVEGNVHGSANYNHSHSTNTSATQLDTYNYSYGASTTLRFPWGMTFSTDINEQCRRGYADAAMNTNQLIWNATLSQRFLPKKTLTVSVRGYDLLQQRDDIARSISATSRTDSRTETINSYFMFSAQWRFGKFGGRSNNSRGNRGEGMGERPAGGDNAPAGRQGRDGEGRPQGGGGRNGGGPGGGGPGGRG